MRNDFSQPRIFFKKKARRQYCVKFLNVISKQEKKNPLKHNFNTILQNTDIFKKFSTHST